MQLRGGRGVVVASVGTYGARAPPLRGRGRAGRIPRCGHTIERSKLTVPRIERPSASAGHKGHRTGRQTTTRGARRASRSLHLAALAAPCSPYSSPRPSPTLRAFPAPARCSRGPKRLPGPASGLPAGCLPLQRCLGDDKVGGGLPGSGQREVAGQWRWCERAATLHVRRVYRRV
jgi:hypothetical protein